MNEFLRKALKRFVSLKRRELLPDRSGAIQYVDIEPTPAQHERIKDAPQNDEQLAEWITSEFPKHHQDIFADAERLKTYEEQKAERTRRIEKNKPVDQLIDIKLLLGNNATKRDGIFQLGEYFNSEYRILTFTDSKEMYVYRSGLYHHNGEAILSKNIQKSLGVFATRQLVNEVISQVQRTTYVDRDSIHEPANKLCLENGIFDLDTMKIEQHNPGLIFFNKVPVQYDPQADCPNIKAFLQEVATNDVQVLQELAGYCLYKRYPIHSAIMLVGSGANGKSTFINILRTFLGKDNCSSIPLQSFENNRFAMAQLHGKLANLFADLPSRALSDTSFFKMLTGEDQIPAEKKFKEGFTFVNYAKMIFSCNQVPRSPDDTDAFFRRWVVITFPNQFIGVKANKKLLGKLTTPEELSGFLNFAIEGLQRLLKEGKFSNDVTIEQVREEYIRKSDSVAAFVMDGILLAPDEHIEKTALYTAYADYCRLNKCPIMPSNTFHQQLQKQVRIEDYRPQKEVDGRKVRVQCWKGLKLSAENKLIGDRVDSPDSPDRHDSKSKSAQQGARVDASTLRVDTKSRVDTPFMDEKVNPVNPVNPFSNLLLRALCKTDTTHHKCAGCELTPCDYEFNGTPICTLCAENIEKQGVNYETK